MTISLEDLKRALAAFAAAEGQAAADALVLQAAEPADLAKLGTPDDMGCRGDIIMHKVVPADHVRLQQSDVAGPNLLIGRQDDHLMACSWEVSLQHRSAML